MLTELKIVLYSKSKQDIDKDKSGEQKPKLEFVEVTLVPCNVVNNNYQLALEVLLHLDPTSSLEN